MENLLEVHHWLCVKYFPKQTEKYWSCNLFPPLVLEDKHNVLMHFFHRMDHILGLFHAQNSNQICPKMLLTIVMKAERQMKTCIICRPQLKTKPPTSSLYKQNWPRTYNKDPRIIQNSTRPRYCLLMLKRLRCAQNVGH